MAVAAYRDGRWGEAEIKPVAPIELSPAAHVLHYASTCFEGFKAFRHADGSVHVFRMDRHIERMRQSARQLVLPEPDAAQLARHGARGDRALPRRRAGGAGRALYCGRCCSARRRTSARPRRRPAEALLLVLASPVWDYFAGGMKPLRILVDDENTRSAAQMGMVKTGGNYAAAMGPTLSARAKFQVDQVLFCPGGEVQETGAANFLLIRDGELLTRGLDSDVSARRDPRFAVDARARPGLRGVRARVRRGGNARMGENRRGGAVGNRRGARRRGHADLSRHGTPGRERRGGAAHARPAPQLVAIQQGEAPDRHGWLERV